MIDQTKDEPIFANETKFRREKVAEQKSYAGWVIGAMALIIVALAIIVMLPHQTLERGSVNSNQSKDGSPPATSGLVAPAPAADPNGSRQ